MLRRVTSVEIGRKKSPEPRLNRRRRRKYRTLLQKHPQKRLKDFTPRELMVELARRGYKGSLEFTETRVIDIQRL